MGKLPERLKLASWYRSVYQKLEPKMWVPKVNPSVYQVIAILLSFIFLVSRESGIRFLLAFVIICLDWWDGATARRYGLAGEEGYMIDVVVDRLSELVMFFPLYGGVPGIIWFVLSLVNLIMSFVSYKTGRHAILPLRFAYLFFVWL